MNSIFFRVSIFISSIFIFYRCSSLIIDTEPLRWSITTNVKTDDSKNCYILVHTLKPEFNFQDLGQKKWGNTKYFEATLDVGLGSTYYMTCPFDGKEKIVEHIVRPYEGHYVYPPSFIFKNNINVESSSLLAVVNYHPTLYWHPETKMFEPYGKPPYFTFHYQPYLVEYNIKGAVIDYLTKGSIILNVIEAESMMPIKDAKLTIKSKIISMDDIKTILKENEYAKKFFNDAVWLKNLIESNNGWGYNIPNESNTKYDGKFNIAIPHLPDIEQKIKILVTSSNHKFFEGEILLYATEKEFDLKLPRLGSKIDLEIVEPLKPVLEKNK